MTVCCPKVSFLTVSTLRLLVLQASKSNYRVLPKGWFLTVSTLRLLTRMAKSEGYQDNVKSNSSVVKAPGQKDASKW